MAIGAGVNNIMDKRVVVTGLGVVSPVGCDIATYWDALKEGKSGIDAITFFDASVYDSRIAGEIRTFNPEEFGLTTKDAHRTARFVQFAIAAAKQAINDAALDLEKEDGERIGVVIGSGIGNLKVAEDEYDKILKGGPGRVSPFMIPMMIVNEAAGQVAINFGLKGPNSCVTTACASGNHSLGEALRLIQRGDADVMVAGGSESCITKLGIAGFCALKALSTCNDEPKKASRPFDAERSGFVMSEGCGLVILESLEHAKRRNARIYAEFAGFGMSCDAYHITAPDPQGQGASVAMKLALKDAKLNPEDITYVNAHGTSTKLNDKIETLAIKKALGDYAKKVMISSTKSITGHLLGAAGGVEFIACVLSIKDDVIHPTINYENPDPDCDLDYVPNTARNVKVNACLSNSLGFGGHNATLAVKKFR